MSRLDAFHRAAGNRDTIDMGHPLIKGLGIHVLPEHESPEWDPWFNADHLHQVHPHEMSHLSAHQSLFTTQSSLSIPTLEHFLRNPNDPSRWIEAEGYDAPHIYTFNGDTWINEGHHRIAASRLRGESSMPVVHNHIRTEWDQ